MTGYFNVIVGIQYVNTYQTHYCRCCLHAGIQGVLDAYRHALTNVKLWGPTNAAPIINHVARFAEQADKNPEAQASSMAVCVLMCGIKRQSPLMCVLAIELLHPADVD